MKNVFIAIGGSGAKVAEALVRLLAIGFPVQNDNRILTSAGNSMQIWRIDPDRNSGAAVALQSCLEEYRKLQMHLGHGNMLPALATSRWAMDIDTRIRNLDPLELPRAADSDNEIRTLRGILDSMYGGKTSSSRLLAPFYENKELDVKIDRGFYQKPFIGAAIMAVFAASLSNDSSPGGQESGLTAFDNSQANFFLCGSLHGGTGASGVPIMGRFLNSRRKSHWGWRIGGCLLAPYCIPPDPPFKAASDGEKIDDKLIDDLLEKHRDKPAFLALKQDQEKRDLVKQILLGFYAEPEDMEIRARHGLSYYKDHGADYFDELYLVGKPEPDKLGLWSNGGSSQSNPLNSAEVVAALAALNFFSSSNTGKSQSYLIAGSTPDLDSQKMSLRQLPKYKISNLAEEIDPERVFLATAILYHLIIQQIPWENRAKNWPKEIEGLRGIYKDNEAKKERDKLEYFETAKLLSEFLLSTIHPRSTIGWDGQDASRIQWFLSNNSVEEIRAKVSKRSIFSKEAKEALTLGNSSIKVSTFEFGAWSPAGDQFTRGEYLRFIWSHLFTRGQGKD
jgi:hypothetical protein